MDDPGLSDAGLLVPRTADYLTLVRDDYVAATGLDVDWDSDLVLGVLSAIMAQRLDQLAEIVQAVYDAFDLNNATGVNLSNLALLVGVRRDRATFATATVTLAGDVGTAIGIGKLVEGGGADGRARWRITEDVIIPIGGEIDVVVEAVVAGVTVATAGEIDTIATPLTGWDSVTNAASASPGTADETDTALRLRRAASIQTSAGIGIRAMRAAVLGLDFITACSVIDNPDNELKVVEGISMLAHSYLVVVLPDTLTSEQEDTLLRTIYDKTPVSTRSSATDLVGTVVGEDGFAKEVGADFGVDVVADFVVNLTMDAGYSVADAGPALQALVEAYIETLSLGDDVLELRIMALAATIPGVRGCTVTINGGGANLVIAAVEHAIMGSWTAT